MVATRAALTALLGFLALAQTATACPLCSPRAPETSVVDRLLQGNTVILARPSRTDPFSYATKEVLKGAPTSDPAGFYLDSATRRKLEVLPSLHAVLVQPQPDKSWKSVGVVDRDLLAVFRTTLSRASAWKKDVSLRHEYFLSLLSHATREVYALAFDETRRAPYEVIRQAKGRVSRERLREILEQPGLAHCRSLAILVLAMDPEESDRQQIHEMAVSSAEQSLTRDLAAILAATVEIKGAEGVTFITEKYLTKKQRTKDELVAAMAALSAHGTKGSRALQDLIVVSYTKLLEIHPSQGAPIARDGLAWKRADLIEPLSKALKTPGTRFGFADRAAIQQYLGRAKFFEASL